MELRRRNAWEEWGEAETGKAFDFAEGYKRFLDRAKTERESIAEGVELAEKKGFKDLDKVKALKPGDKIYKTNKDRNLILAIIGRDVRQGFRLVMSHIDTPRIDLKVNPLYEDEDLAFFKTHYYGGIKKYHWPTIPLALHGTAILADGRKIEIRIGEKEDEPIFMITDLLPHLSRKQYKKTLDEAVMAEELNVLVGSVPVKDKKIKSKVKLAVLKYLNDRFGMTSEDFFSAEIRAVPDAKARDLGFDRSMVAAYGQDDRVCAYASLAAMLEARPAAKTQVCLWIDKEETGSEGNTGAQSLFFENFIAEVLEKAGSKASMAEVFKIFERSEALSSDVIGAFDPDYKYVYDPLNTARLGYGVALERHTGAGGKYYTSEASAEYTQKIRKILNDNKVIWQTSSLGKVDEGGGGTIAVYMAKRNLEIIDIGVPLLNMHAPMEIASKADIYSAYLAYKAFYKN